MPTTALRAVTDAAQSVVDARKLVVGAGAEDLSKKIPVPSCLPPILPAQPPFSPAHLPKGHDAVLLTLARCGPSITHLERSAAVLDKGHAFVLEDLAPRLKDVA